MKKNYIAPEMEVHAINVLPLCLSMVEGDATNNPVLSRRFDSSDLFLDDTDE